MGKLVIHNHYREQDKSKRDHEILEIVVDMIKKKQLMTRRG